MLLQLPTVFCRCYANCLTIISQSRFELGGVVVFAPVGDFVVVAGDEDAGGEAGGVAGEAVAAGEFPLAGGRVVLRDERAQREADLSEGAEEGRERLANGGYAAKRLTGGAGKDRIRRKVLQNGIDVRSVPGGGLVPQDRGGCAGVGWHRQETPFRWHVAVGSILRGKRP